MGWSFFENSTGVWGIGQDYFFSNKSFPTSRMYIAKSWASLPSLVLISPALGGASTPGTDDNKYSGQTYDGDRYPICPSFSVFAHICNALSWLLYIYDPLLPASSRTNFMIFLFLFCISFSPSEWSHHFSTLCTGSCSIKGKYAKHDTKKVHDWRAARIPNMVISPPKNYIWRKQTPPLPLKWQMS